MSCKNVTQNLIQMVLIVVLKDEPVLRTRLRVFSKQWYGTEIIIFIFFRLMSPGITPIVWQTRVVVTREGIVNVSVQVSQPMHITAVNKELW